METPTRGTGPVGPADNSGGIIGSAGSVLPVPLRHKLLSGQACGPCGAWLASPVIVSLMGWEGGVAGSGLGAALLCHMPARGGTAAHGSSQLTAREPSLKPYRVPFLLQALHLAALLFAVSLLLPATALPYREPEPSVAEPPFLPPWLGI